MSVKTDRVHDCWEEIDETELNRNLEQLKKVNKSDITSILNRPSATQLSISDQNELRPAPLNVAESAVKILRRPRQNGGEKSIEDNKPKVPVKTLKQREQEYAQARLRILGSAKNPDEDIEEKPSLTTNCTATNQNINQEQQENGISIFRLSLNSNSPSSTIITSAPSLENVIRMPKGPDGTTGFTMRR